MEPAEGIVTKGGPHALDRLVRLHVIEIAAADRRWLDGRRGVPRPRDGFRIKGRLPPACHRADVEGRLAKPDRPIVDVGVLRRAVERLDQHLSGLPAQGDHSREQLIQQLVPELAHEVALPVVPVLAVGRVEQVLLREERAGAHAVVDEARGRAQRSQLLWIRIGAGVAGRDDLRAGALEIPPPIGSCWPASPSSA